jgi:hypothetical protein
MKKLISLATSLMMTMLVATTIIVPASGAGEVSQNALYDGKTVAIEPVNTTSTPTSTLVISEDDLASGNVTETIGVYLYRDVAFCAATWNIGVDSADIIMEPIKDADGVEVASGVFYNEGKAISGQGNAIGGIMGPVNSGTGDQIVFADAVGGFATNMRYAVTFSTQEDKVLKADGAMTSENTAKYDAASSEVEGTVRREYYLSKFDITIPSDIERGVYHVMFDWTEGNGTEKGVFMKTVGNSESPTVDVAGDISFKDLTIVVGEVEQIAIEIGDVTVDPEAAGEVLTYDDGTKYVVAKVPVTISGDSATQTFAGLQSNLRVTREGLDAAETALECYPDGVERSFTDTYGDTTILNEDGALSQGDVKLGNKTLTMEPNAATGGYNMVFARDAGTTAPAPLEDGTVLIYLNFVVELDETFTTTRVYDVEFVGNGFTQMSVHKNGSADPTPTLGEAGEFVLYPGTITVLGLEEEVTTTEPVVTDAPVTEAPATTAATTTPEHGEATGGIVAAMVVLALAGAAAVVAKKKFN